MSFDRVHVIGAGAWGTALAQCAALAGREVTLVARDPAVADRINETGVNSVYLPGQALSERIEARSDFDGIAEADIVLMVVPAQASREFLDDVGRHTLSGTPVVMCAKGLERGTLARQSEIAAEKTPEAVPMVLSGPSFAADVVAGRPTAVTLAAADIAAAEAVAQALAGPTFRLYASADLVGVELAGALKNVYALACGAVEGAQLGLSARAALIARAYAEMARLVEAMGGQAVTLTGLAGLGDLTLSCTSERSRNYAFGVALGQGRLVDEIRETTGTLAEGVMTAPVAQSLARKFNVDTPLIEAVNLLLGGAQSIEKIVAQLMARPLKREGLL